MFTMYRIPNFTSSTDHKKPPPKINHSGSTTDRIDTTAQSALNKQAAPSSTVSQPEEKQRRNTLPGHLPGTPVPSQLFSSDPDLTQQSTPTENPSSNRPGTRKTLESTMPDSHNLQFPRLTTAHQPSTREQSKSPANPPRKIPQAPLAAPTDHARTPASVTSTITSPDPREPIPGGNPSFPQEEDIPHLVKGVKLFGSENKNPSKNLSTSSGSFPFSSSPSENNPHATPLSTSNTPPFQYPTPIPQAYTHGHSHSQSSSSSGDFPPESLTDGKEESPTPSSEQPSPTPSLNTALSLLPKFPPRSRSNTFPPPKVSTEKNLHWETPLHDSQQHIQLPPSPSIPPPGLIPPPNIPPQQEERLRPSQNQETDLNHALDSPTKNEDLREPNLLQRPKTPPPSSSPKKPEPSPNRRVGSPLLILSLGALIILMAITIPFLLYKHSPQWLRLWKKSS